MHDLLVPNVRRLMKRGVVTAAITAGGLIVDGGTAAGVMDMVGSALAGAPPRTLRLLGVCPAPLIARPDAPQPPPPGQPHLEALEPHHSNFVLVPASDWGGETSTMFTFAAVLSDRLPCAAVLANGGFISRKEVLYAVRHKIPVVILEGSGRLADTVRSQCFCDSVLACGDTRLLRFFICCRHRSVLQLAKAIHKRDETPPEQLDMAALHPDAEVQEIMAKGTTRREAPLSITRGTVTPRLSPLQVTCVYLT